MKASTPGDRGRLVPMNGAAKPVAREPQLASGVAARLSSHHREQFIRELAGALDPRAGESVLEVADRVVAAVCSWELSEQAAAVLSQRRSAV